MKAYFNWSGGKDSALSLHRILQESKYPVHCLLTSVNSTYDRISMHGVRRELLEVQARSIGIPLQTIELPEQPGMQEYEHQMKQKVLDLQNEGCTHAIFGDIFLEDLKHYREEQLRRQNIQCVFPLWRQDTKTLMKEFLEAGFKAIVVCVNGSLLDHSFCGRIIDESFVADLPGTVDVCGENGEYHSFVFDGPVFQQPVSFQIGDIVERRYKAPGNKEDNCFTDAPPPECSFYFCDLFL